MDRSPTDIECIHGIKIISAFLIVLGHRLSRTENFFPHRFHDDWFLWQFFVNAIKFIIHSTDIFFTVSGFLVVRSLLISISQQVFKYLHSLKSLNFHFLFRRKFNYPKFIFLRVTRYIPSIAILYLFFMSVLPRFFLNGDRPLAYHLDDEIEMCHKYWWSNLFLFRNFAEGQVSEQENLKLRDFWEFTWEQVYVMATQFIRGIIYLTE